MAVIEEALRAWLLTDATIGPLVGAVQNPSGPVSGWVGQAWKESIPQGTPSIATSGLCILTFAIDSEPRERSLSGVTSDKNARVKLNLEAPDEATLNTLVEAIAGTPTAPKLDGFGPGQFGGGGVSLWTQYIEIEDRPDDFTPNPHAGDLGTFLSHLALNIAYVSP